MKFVARFLTLVLVVIGFIGVVAMYGQWRIGSINDQLDNNQSVVASDQAQIESVERQLYQERLVNRELLLGAVVVAAFIAALLINITRKPIVALSAKAKKLEASNSLLAQDLAKQNQQLGYQAKVAESERSKYEAILDSLIDGMITCDINGNVILINDPALKILGIDDDCIHGKPVYDAAQFLDDDNAAIGKEQHPIYQSLNAGQKVVRDLSVVLPEAGVKRMIRVSATVIRTKDETIGAIAILRDITQEVQVDRMKTDFISLASHQLRTPLSAIRWFSEMLYNGDAGKLLDEQKEYAKNIVDSTLRMIELVNGLLNISRMESGRIIVDPKPTDLSQLIGSIVNDLRLKIDERHHEVTVSVQQDVGKINLDAQLISQVYMNFLTNAIKYTPDGGKILINVWRKGTQIISQVSDNGYGIPKEDQAKIYHKFFRAANAVKVETDGTGLGMYLVRSIITSSGGRIWMHSEEGRGTTFWFSLPASGMKKKDGEVSLDM